MNKHDWVQRRNIINALYGHEPILKLGFECFPYDVNFDVENGQISINQDHRYFFYVTRETIDQLTGAIMQGLKAIKFIKVDQRLNMLVHSIFDSHIRELMATNPAFHQYVTSNKA